MESLKKIGCDVSNVIKKSELIDHIEDLDLKATKWVNLHRFKFLDPLIMQTEKHNKNFVYFFPLVMGGFSLITQNKSSLEASKYALFSVMATSLVKQVLKKWVHRKRPYNVDYGIENLVLKRSSSFPSNHTAISFALATSLARSYPQYSYLFYGIASVMAYARLHMGVHYVSDVLGGAVLGYTLGAMITPDAKQCPKRRKRLIIASTLGTLFLVFIVLKYRKLNQVYDPIWFVQDKSFDDELKKEDPAAFYRIAHQLGEPLSHRWQRIQDKMIAPLHKKLQSHGIEDAEILGRPKAITSINRKMLLNNLDSVKQLHDVEAICVVVPSVKECYQVLDIIQPDVQAMDDYIAQPKINNYQAIHTILKDKYDHLYECQIKTPAMLQAAQSTHDQYKLVQEQVYRKMLNVMRTKKLSRKQIQALVQKGKEIVNKNM